MKVGGQIVARRWQGKAAAHPSFLSDMTPQLALIQIIIIII